MTETDTREQGKRSRPMGTSDSWQDSDAPAGGIGTLTRPAAPPSPREPKGAPPSGLRSDEARNELRRDEGRRRVQAPGGERGRGKRQLPFFLLLCALLGGALVCVLVITTTLAAGSFEISKLENSTTAQTKQLQSLQEQVAQAQSPPQIESRAAELGMRPVGALRFVDLKTGKLTTNATDWQAYVPPGYTP